MRKVPAAQFTMLLATASIALVGCGKQSDLVPVSGRVTIDGKPVTVGQVMVSATGHRPAFGPLDDQGRFQLTSYEAGDGVPLGNHTVAVMATEQIDERTVRWHTPKKYANELTSGLSIAIEGPTDDVQLELTWKGDSHRNPFDEKL